MLRSSLLVGLLLLVAIGLANGKPRDEIQDAITYLTRANEALRAEKNIISLSSWEQSSNITDANNAAYLQASEKYDAFLKQQFDEVKNFFGVMPQLEPKYRRQLEKMGVIGTSALSVEDSKKFSEVSLNMRIIYSEATVTVDGESGLALEPHLTDILATSTNENKLRQAWMTWRDATGPHMKSDYKTYYELGNKAAVANQLPGSEFRTYDDLWMAEWETPDMKDQVDTLMAETLPLYRKIHAYVRHFLTQQYGPTVMPKDGTIPAHLLGNMWAQQWSNVLNNITAMNPHPDVDIIDNKVNEKLKGWTVKQMFELSETFFHDLGMHEMTPIFWDKSILEKPADRNLTCHASAWDFSDLNEQDFRIKQCTEKTISDLITVHHEMGHIQYYHNYVKQPVIYRRGGNPGFHEAIGDLIALSVATPQHLIKVGLLDAETDANLEKINLNYQLKMALDKVAFLPFAYVMDKWRWDVFGNPAMGDKLNRRWWQLRLKFQGVSPPTADRKRKETDFDPGAKYHIPAGVEYVRYFASHVLQFQFYEKMCSYVPDLTELYKCDFDGNKEAGAALMKMLAEGSSDNWQNILERFIGSKTMSLSSLNKYFRPLEAYLDDFIAKNNIAVGWNPVLGNYFELDADNYLDGANDEYADQNNVMIEADWAQGSNITEENEAALVEAIEVYNEFRQKQFLETKDYDYSGMVAAKKRQFEKFAVIGTSALGEADTKTFNEAKLRMEATYSTAAITANGTGGLELEPDLTHILATSNDEKVLKEVWVNFRDATGAKMREDYITYYTLGNKAAGLNQLPDKNFTTFDDLWMFSWETPDMKQQVDTLMGEAMLLYQKVHAYVRFHLTKQYGTTVMPKDGTIPAHLLGNMWAQSWSNILNVIPALNPNPDVDPIDEKVNQKLAGWSIRQMYELSEKFFADLGLGKMTQIFWDKSILEKPAGINMTCHASAWDFFKREDFRIKQCTEKTINQLVTVHHEMGHIQYFMEYAVQPPIYREGANPGFHEAIGDLIALSVATPEHLTKVGLLDQVNNPAELAKINLNYQMKMALDKVVFLPFAYVMDKWRWNVFGDEKMKDTLNRHWWELRLKHQGVSPPVKRSEKDFDPGAKYHIPAGVEYVRYFVSHVLQFQFFKKMCAANTAPFLYQCDFDGDKTAGAGLIKMLQAGSSDTWQNILKEFIGDEKMSLSAMDEYFKPLNDFLDKFIADNNIKPGWEANVNDYMSGSLSATVSFWLMVTSLVAFFWTSNRSAC